MEMELSSLINKIKVEGVDQAEKQAHEIIAAAQKQANSIIEKAKKEEASIIEDAKAKARDFQAQSEKAIAQAERDVLLTLREKIIAFFNAILKKNVKSQLTQDVLKEAIIKAVDNFSKNKSVSLEIVVAKEDKAKLEKMLFEGLAKELKNSITVKGSETIEKGFRIGEEGKDSYFDFTDEIITEAFASYLNPKLLSLLDENLKKQ